MLPFFLSHYLNWMRVDRVIVHDNMSTDATKQICQATRKVTWRPYDTGGKHSDKQHMTAIRNECWKEAKYAADAVIIVDCDELLYHNDIARFLSQTAFANASVAVSSGYEMVTDTFPAKDKLLVDSVRSGMPSEKYSKPCILFPHRIKEIQFKPGAHSCDVSHIPGSFVMRSAGLRLLHYPRLGWDYYIERVRDRRRRASKADKEANLSNHYDTVDKVLYRQFQVYLKSAIDVVT